VFSVVPGPGVLNASAALLTAFGCNAPVLCLTGQVPSGAFGKGRGHLHEMPDQLGVLSRITKWAVRIETAASAPALVAEAFREMTSGRPGPAALEMFWDKLGAAGEVKPLPPLPKIAPPPVDGDAVARAAKAVAAARTPMIFVGGGAIEAADEVRGLAERLGAPVAAFRSGRGIVGDDDPLGVTIAEAWPLWLATDCAIIIGSRFEVPGWRWGRRPDGLTTVRIDIDPVEFRRMRSDVDILGDAADATAALSKKLARASLAAADRKDAIAEAKAKTAKEIASVKPHVGYLRAIREVLPADGIFVDEMCQAGFASWYGFPVFRPRTFLSTGYQGTLGAGFPTALGAKVAKPDVPVVSITGDGGFLFAATELATAVQYGIGATVIVFNNGAYGNVRRDQITGYEGRISGSELVSPDFVKFARSFGVGATRVTSPAALRRALEEAFASDAPRLIEIPVDPDAEVSPWPFIHRDKPY
jgi:acetolactate synthase-1/2/3 large subunit